VRVGARKDAWTIPKLELLQSVVPSICLSGVVMQWSANVTEHAHIQEIKVPARAGNNQNYYSQIARYLDCSEKCFRFDLATHLHSQGSQVNWGEDDEDEVFEQGDEHESYPEDLSVADHMATFRPISNYFAVADALQCGSIPTAIKLYRTFSTTMTAFHLASKPSLHLSLDEAAEMFKIPDLHQALVEYLHRLENGTHIVSGTRSNHCTLPFDRIQIWYKVHTQQMQYYISKVPDAPQTLRAVPPSTSCPHGLYNAVVINAEPQSEWP